MFSFTGERAQPRYLRTDTFPMSIPKQYPCRSKTFYVRKCYPEYYDLILREFEQDIDIVIVTGTSGTQL